MEKFEISVDYNQQYHHFEIKDYMHHTGGQCKYEVYKDGVFVASFEPGPHNHLSICKDPGVETEELLDLVADEIERYHI